MANFYKFASDNPFLTFFLACLLAMFVTELFKITASIFRRDK